ncbi:MAG: hypothetical protein Q7S84_01685 [bacterium]|nr:hypothetical protein [bacterium]
MACKGGAWCGAGRGSCHGGWWMVVRIVIMLAIVAGAFAAGVKAGEFRAWFGGGYGSSYGPRMMQGYSNRGYGMMGRWYDNMVPTAPTTPPGDQPAQ